MKLWQPQHASACHPERSEGSLSSRIEEALRCARGDGYCRHFTFRAGPGAGIAASRCQAAAVFRRSMDGFSKQKTPKTVAGLRGGSSLKRRLARHPELLFPLPPCAVALACRPFCGAAFRTAWANCWVWAVMVIYLLSLLPTGKTKGPTDF